MWRHRWCSVCSWQQKCVRSHADPIIRRKNNNKMGKCLSHHFGRLNELIFRDLLFIDLGWRIHFVCQTNWYMGRFGRWRRCKFRIIKCCFYILHVPSPIKCKRNTMTNESHSIVSQENRKFGHKTATMPCLGSLGHLFQVANNRNEKGIFLINCMSIGCHT